jgi:hypothetical protein
VDDDRAVEMVMVDQAHGPVMPCTWLGWAKHPDGFTHAWLEGTEPGELAVPADWTAERSRALQRSDIREEPGRAMRLASENGIETWLDFHTGQLVRGLAPAAAAGPAEEERARMDGPIASVLRAALDARGWRYTWVAERGMVDLPVAGDHALYRLVGMVNEGGGQLVLYTLWPVRVPEARRAAAAELLMRASRGCTVGALELDFTDGGVRCRAGVDVEGGTLTEPMVHALIAYALWLSDHWFGALMKVVYAQAEPQVAVAEVEGAHGA